MARPRKELAEAAIPERSPVTEPTARKRRTPVGQRNILSVQGKDSNYVYRFVNDVGDRVQQFLEGGYELVDAETHRVGDNRVGNATPEGSHAEVNVGGGVKAKLMRIPRSFYEEDQQVKQAQVDKIEESLKQAGDYGTVTIDKSGSRG